MQILSKPDNSSERLQDNKANNMAVLDFNKIKNSHALEYRGEIEDVSRMCRSIGEDKKSDIVNQWAARSQGWAEKTNMIGEITGFNTDLSLKETTRAYTEKSKLKDVIEFGDLHSFDIEGNNQFLEELSADNQPVVEVHNDYEVDRSDLALVRARDLVDQLAKDYPINDGRFNTDDYQFALAA